MSSMDIAVLMDRVGARRGLGEAETPLRIVLCGGETLRLPRRPLHLRVLSGAAWVTRSGRDVVLREGERLDLCGRGDRAVVSALGDGALLLEAR